MCDPIVGPGAYSTPSFSSSIFPTEIRLGASSMVAMSMLSAKAAISPLRSTQPTHHPIFGLREVNHPVLP